MLKEMKSSGALGFFAGTTALAWVMIWFLMPETKQRSLEQLSVKFDVNLKEFALKRLRRLTSQQDGDEDDYGTEEEDDNDEDAEHEMNDHDEQVGQTNETMEIEH